MGSGVGRIGLAVAAALVQLACVSGPNVGDRLHELIDREWEARLVNNPLLATSVGRHEFNDRLPDVSPPNQQRRATQVREFLDELEAIDRARLSAADQINYDIFERQLRAAIADFGFRAFEMPLTADSGFHTDFAQLPFEAPFETPGDYENYIARLEAFPSYVEQQISNMRAGLERGFSVPQVVLEGYQVTMSTHIVDDPRESVFFEPFERLSEADPLRAEGGRVVVDSASTGYRAMLEFFEAEYLPKARRSVGASQMPDGAAYYAQRIRHFTTLDLAPEQVHEVGLSEVARIRSEMDAVIEEVGFKGSFNEFLEFLRSAPRFYPKTGEELLMRAAYIAKQMDAKLPLLFRTLPRLTYGVAPVPAHLAPKYTGGRYSSAPAGSGRPGYYWVNTYKLESRPLYVLESLTFHEAVPGHHLQFALANEQTALPNFRRYEYIEAFGEGWGLYAEWLGLEAGFYSDPYSNFGRLTYEMWRDCRLVVDTGIHAMGWTRRQAIDYLASNTALSLHEVTTEVDRYISWPGQALAYKMGELKIKELRREAEAALGEGFEVRDFHDAVLLNGPVPLPVLERIVRRYISAARLTQG